MSAITEGTYDALCELNFLQVLHISGKSISLKVCDSCMTFKVTQGHQYYHY